MALPAPKPTPYTAAQWRAESWTERLRLACAAWAVDGYGTPPAIYALYVLKVLLYVGAWIGFASLSNAEDAALVDRLLTADAFKKAVVWSMAFESLGLGCGSGPLTGRYLPPVAAPLHFLRPGTIKLPPWPVLPLFGSTRRGWFDVLLYATHLVLAVRILVAPVVTPELVLPSIAVLAALGLSDKTIFIAARSEHYGALLVCFAFPDWLAGAVVVQLGIWLWAGVSKLNRHFPAVMCVMISNSPVARFAALRRAMYRSFPEDLRPSRLAHVMAHVGTTIELSFAWLLLFGDGGTLTVVGLVTMLAFHLFITSHVPMAVPIEWNVFVVYAGFFLFGVHAEVSPLELQSPLLVAFLILVIGVVPLVGNLWPRWVSFLMSMRYYAGNWAWSVWLFEDDAAADRLDRIIKASERPERQLARLYDAETITTVLTKVPAFRAMHLHGRALSMLVPRAVDSPESRVYVDGEIVAGIVLGYNFGDGHLHDHRLLAEVQKQCGFEPGQLRHIQVESQPLFRPRLRFEIHDAADGLLDEGMIGVDELLARQPWGDLVDDARLTAS